MDALDECRLSTPSREWERSPATECRRVGSIRRRPQRARVPSCSREWERHDAAVALSTARRRGPRWFLAVAVLVALVGALVVITSPTQNRSAVAPTEPAVLAEDLPLGAMYHVVDQVGARGLWEAGVTGAGVNVAVIDTGIAPVESLSGDGKVAAVVDLSADAGNPATQFVDGHGHGTHLAGIIAGREPGADPARAAEHPEWFLGVAPDAGIVSVKVADQAGRVRPNDLVSGIDWVVEHADELGIRVLNLSLDSGSETSYRADPLAAAVERAWAAGIVVVTAAGNGGAEAAGLDSPATDPYAIAVAGAEVDETGTTIADWSSSGDGVRDPDLAAPGAHIDSLRAPGSDADVNHPEGFVDAETFRGSGSSQAAAVVSGAAALLLDARPELTPDQVKAALTSTAMPLDAASVQAGAGLIDVQAAARAEASTVAQDWPNAASPEVRVHSPGAAAVWTGTTWTGTTWTGTTWTGTTWTGTTWTGTTWTGTTWTGTTWTGTTWTGTTWTGTTWTGTTWTGTTWTGTTWTGTTWTGTTWTGTTWTGTTWTGTTWTGTTWT